MITALLTSHPKPVEGTDFYEQLLVFGVQELATPAETFREPKGEGEEEGGEEEVVREGRKTWHKRPSSQFRGAVRPIAAV